jgi:hypothetical protein
MPLCSPFGVYVSDLPCTVQLFLEDSLGDFELINESGPFDGYFVSFLFYATTAEPEHPYYEVPSVDGDYESLTLTISFDEFPEEIGIELRSRNGTLIFYRPPRFYIDEALVSTVETIVLLAEADEYILTVFDVYGDGMEKGFDAGYSLEHGSILLASSDFETGFSENVSFAIGFAESSPTTAPQETGQTPTPAPRMSQEPTQVPISPIGSSSPQQTLSPSTSSAAALPASGSRALPTFVLFLVLLI